MSLLNTVSYLPLAVESLGLDQSIVAPLSLSIYAPAYPLLATPMLVFTPFSVWITVFTWRQ